MSVLSRIRVNFLRNSSLMREVLSTHRERYQHGGPPESEDRYGCYHEEFDSKEYIDLVYTSPVGNQYTDNGFMFRWEQLFKFFRKYNRKWNNKTARMLEFGGGPVITPLISAAPYVDQITFAAYLENERKEVELWKHRKEGAHDWSSHFKYVVNEVENIAGNDAWREREEMLRNRISVIVPCDALGNDPLPIKQEPFEIISTSICLEAACTSYLQYKEAVKRLIGLLKPGGFSLMAVPERTTFYKVGKNRWPSLHLTFEEVKEALAEAGMVIFVAERDPFPMELIQNPEKTDKKGYLFVAAQKVEF